MKIFKKLLLGTAFAASIIASPAFAQNITGALNFGVPGGTNYFDPANGFVPAGYGNAAGTTVAIGSGTEFGFQDSANLDTANFTGTSLTIIDQSISGASNFLMTFTSSTAGLFNSAAFSSNGFGGTFLVTGNTLTFSEPAVTSAGTRTSVITFAGATGAVPEPATWAMMLLGFGAMGATLRRRSQQVRVRYA
jgi:hypothetical protein